MYHFACKPRAHFTASFTRYFGSHLAADVNIITIVITVAIAIVVTVVAVVGPGKGRVGSRAGPLHRASGRGRRLRPVAQERE